MPTPDSAARFIGGQLAAFEDARRSDALAVFALLPEVRENAHLRSELSGCLFSLDKATALMRTLGSPSPQQDATDLVAFLSGLLFDTFFGVRSFAPERERPVADSVERVLRAMILAAR